MYVCNRLSSRVDVVLVLLLAAPMPKSYSSSMVYVLVIARARVPHVGYWHGSDVEPEGPKARGLYVTTVPITYTVRVARE